jgi:hypothetical protein
MIHFGKEEQKMRTGLCVLLFAVLLFTGCHRAQVQMTVTYDRSPQREYPYASYGNVATIYWTIGVKNFQQEIHNHQSIKMTVPARTTLRASLQKFVTDVNGFQTATEDVFYTADHDHPVWKF